MELDRQFAVVVVGRGLVSIPQFGVCWATMAVVLPFGVMPASNDHPYTNQQCGTSPQSMPSHRSSFVIPEQIDVQDSCPCEFC